MSTSRSEPPGSGLLGITEESPEDWEQRVSGALPARALRDPERPIHVIIKVARPGYVPNDILVRSQTSADILTAETTWQHLPTLARDPLIVSVALAEKIAAPR